MPCVSHKIVYCVQWVLFLASKGKKSQQPQIRIQFDRALEMNEKSLHSSEKSCCLLAHDTKHTHTERQKQKIIIVVIDMKNHCNAY